MSSGNASRPLKVGRLCFQRIALLLRCLTKGITLHDATHHRFSFYLASSPRYPLSFEETLTASLGESRPRFSEWGWIASECDLFLFSLRLLCVSEGWGVKNEAWFLHDADSPAGQGLAG